MYLRDWLFGGQLLLRITVAIIIANNADADIEFLVLYLADISSAKEVLHPLPTQNIHAPSAYNKDINNSAKVSIGNPDHYVD